MKKFFKLKNLFFVTFLAVAGFFSYAAVAISKQVEETPVVEKAEATVPACLFLKPGVWNASGAKFAVWVFSDGVAGQWSSFMSVYPGNSDYYYVTIPTLTSRNNCSFVRLDSACTSPDWNYKWNQTNDITPGSNNLCTITGWDQSNFSMSELTITTDLYFRGSMNGWAADDDTKFSCTDNVHSKTFTKTMALHINDTFKPADDSFGWKLESDSKGVDKKTIGAVEGHSRLSGTEDGQKNLLVVVPGTFTFSFTLYYGGSWICNSVTYSPFSVTVNLDKQSGSGGTTSVTATYGSAMPSGKAAPTRSGYVFRGYFDEVNGGGTQYYNESMASAHNWDKDTNTATTLYAYWLDLNPTIYFVNGFSWEYPHAYYFGGTASVDYPGSTMEAMHTRIHCQVGDTWYDIDLYKYTITGCAKYVQFNKGNDSEKTDDLLVSNGTIYWYGVNAEKFGSVAEYLKDFVNAMGSYTYEGKSYSQSLCSFSSSQASSFVSRYNTLATSADNDVVKSINNSTIYTYSVPVTNPSTKADIKIPVLVAQVSKNISGGVYNSIRSFSPFNIMSDESGLPTIIIIVASSVALLSITALSVLVVKKRKTKEQ